MKIDRDDEYYIYYIVRYNIKKYRKKMGITSQELADLSGYSHQFIRNLQSLNTVMRPRLDSLYRIASALNISIKQLFDDIDDYK